MLDIQAENQKFRQKLGNRQEPTYKPEAQVPQPSPAPTLIDIIQGNTLSFEGGGGGTA